MITIRKRDLDRIFEHGRDGYPHEVCGIIMGTYGEASKRVEEIRIAGNLNTERAHDRYEMDPKDILKAKEFERKKWYVFGSMAVAIMIFLTLTGSVIRSNRDAMHLLYKANTLVARYAVASPLGASFKPIFPEAMAIPAVETPIRM